MTPLFTVSEIRALEARHGTAGLMEKAGLAAATLAQELILDGLPVLVLAGPGNNGGDALVAARHLTSAWHKVDVVFTGDAAKLPDDAHAACAAWLASGGEILTEIPTEKNYGLIIDGLFGIGLTRELDEKNSVLIDQINRMNTSVLALDMPSGLCADSGRVLGNAVIADHTLTFLGLKPGLCTLDGPDHAGTVHSTDLGISPQPAQGWLINTAPALPPPRLKNSHKGSYGSVAVMGGADTMTGAAILAARAALLTGAGRVYCGLLSNNPPAVDFGQPELMLRNIDSLLELETLSVWIIGPGMGRLAHSESALRRTLHHAAPLVLDADALHLIAENPDLKVSLQSRSAGTTVITPHPGEAASLLNCSTADIQRDRVGAALRIAREYHTITVLKGCGSIIATPGGDWFINASGNPGLSSAGMGDVLAGILGSLIAQSMECLDATLLAVYLHGAAADSLVADGFGPVGLTASEVALEARNLLNEMQRDMNHRGHGEHGERQIPGFPRAPRVPRWATRRGCG